MGFQSTFPHGERLVFMRRTDMQELVSIHVPARGTTYGCSDPFYADGTFQSTFPHGERHDPCAAVPGKRSFNPRSRTGNDEGLRRCGGLRQCVSIHVPARGTTGVSPQSAPGVRSFNPRSRTGNDYYHVPIVLTIIVSFNPRSRTGNDGLTDEQIAHNMGFNPRSRTGNDEDMPFLFQGA